MNSLKFYNEYLTAGERETARQWGQNISEPPKQEKQEARKIFDASIRDILENTLFKKNLVENRRRELTDQEILNKLRSYIDIYQPGSKINKTYRNTRFFMVNNGPLYVSHENENSLIHIHLYVFHKAIHGEYITMKMATDQKLVNQHNSYLFGIMRNDEFVGYSDLYLPGFLDPPPILPKHQDVLRYKPQLESYGIKISKNLENGNIRWPRDGWCFNHVDDAEDMIDEDEINSVRDDFDFAWSYDNNDWGYDKDEEIDFDIGLDDLEQD